MHRNRRGAVALATTLLISAAILMGLPALSAAANLLDGVNDLVERSTGIKLLPDRAPAEPGGSNGSDGGGASGAGNNQGDPGGFQPPLHGKEAHGQGTSATVDLDPSADRPYTADPAEPEAIVLGRSQGQQADGKDGKYSGHITVAALFGSEVIGVDTHEGEESNGPLEPIQDLLDTICDGSASNVCVDLVKVESKTDKKGSTNKFKAVGARLGPDLPVTGSRILDASVIDSEGTITQDGKCQSSTGASNVADADVLGALSADAISASSLSQACAGGKRSVANGGNVVNLNAAGLPVPAKGCEDGTPDTEFDLAGLVQAVCNPDDVDGEGEDSKQTKAPYGVRQGLEASILPGALSNSALVRAVTTSGESHAVAPSGDGGGGGGNGGGGKGGGGHGNNDKRPHKPHKPNHPKRDRGGGGSSACSDLIDNDGDGLVDFGSDPGCSSTTDTSEGDGGAGLGAGAGAAAGGAGAGAGAADDAECDDGKDNDGDGKTDFPDDPECTSADDDSESTLASTGSDLLLLALIGGIALASGLSLRSATAPREPRRRVQRPA